MTMMMNQDVDEYALEAYRSNLLRSLSENEGLWDVSLHLGREGSGTAVVNCHRHMLAAHSPTFAQIFRDSAIQNNFPSKPGGGRMTLRVECDPDAFSDLLTYMYSGKVNIRPEHAIEALSVSMYYQIEPLVRAYSSFAEACIKVPEEFVIRLLDNDALNVSEVDAFEAVVKWGKAKFGEQPGSERLKQKLARVMSHVRFPMMEGKEMADRVEQVNVVDKELLLEAYRFKATGGDSKAFAAKLGAQGPGQPRRFLPRSRAAGSSLRPPDPPSFVTSYISQQPGDGDFQSKFSSVASSAHKPIALPMPQTLQPGPLVGVGLGLSLHSSLNCMVVTEVARWCEVHSGDLQRMEVGDMLKSIDGWQIVRNVDAVKKHLLGPSNTLVTLQVLRGGAEYSAVLVRGSSEKLGVAGGRAQASVGGPGSPEVTI